LSHFLSKPRDALRPRPWPIASVATLTTINRLNTRIPNSFPRFIGSSLKTLAYEVLGAAIGYHSINLYAASPTWVIMLSYQIDSYGNR
jgi:hypothetical protein